MVAWKIGGGNKYIEWALNYGKKFAKRITDSDEIIPVAWGLDGTRFYPEDMKEKAERFLAANHHHLTGDKLSGLENFIASGAIYAFGDLYSVSQDIVFKEAAKEIVSKLLNCVSNPYADPVAAAISYYRNAFEDYSFDEKIIDKPSPPRNPVIAGLTASICSIDGPDINLSNIKPIIIIAVIA